MKRVLSLFLSCIFVLGVCFSTPIVASATGGDATEPETLVGTEFGEPSRYEILSVAEGDTQGTCALIKYAGTGPNVTISGSAMYDEIVSYKVTQISAGAFSENSTVEAITIPATVTEIADGAFAGCTNLRYVKFSATKGTVDQELIEKIPENVTIHYSDCNVADYEGVGETITFFCNCNNDETAEYACGDITLVGEDSIVYDGKPHEVTPKVSGNVSIYDSETMKVLYNDETKPTNAGTYTAKLTLVEADEEKGIKEVSATKTFEITPKTLTAENVALTVSEGTYTGLAQVIGITVKDGETLLTEADYTITYKRQNGDVREETSDLTSVGTIFVEVAGKGNYAGIVTKEYVINKAELTITIEEPQQLLYVGNDFNNLNWISTGLMGTDEIKSISFEHIGDEFSEEGEFELSYESAVIENEAGNDVTKNYNVSCNSVTVNIVECAHDEIEEGKDATCQNKAVCKTCGEEFGEKEPHDWEFTVDGTKITATCQTDGCAFNTDPVEITLTAPSTGLVYDGTAKTADVTVSAENSGIEIPEIEYSGDRVNVTEDGYTATIKLGESENVVIATINLKITPKQLTDNEIVVAGIENSYVYTGSYISPEISVTDNEKQLVSSTDYTVNYSDDIINAGTVTVTVTGIGNYTGEVKETYTIEPKEITATLTQDSGVYNGNTHQPTVKISGLCGTETLTNGTDFTVEYSDNINVGTVTVTVTLEETSVAKNYTFANNAKTTTLNYTITAGVASIKTAPTVKTGLVYTGSAQELVTAGEATNGTMQYRLSEDESWSTTIPSGINAKTYTVYYKVKGDLNYSDSDVASVDVAIAKATPTTENFKIDLPTNLIFNGDPKTVTVTCGADIGDITVEYYSGETKLESAPVEVGTYTVKINVAASDNYNAANGITSDAWGFTVTACTKHEWKNSKCEICKIDCEHKYEDGKSAISNTISKHPTCVEEGVLLSQCKICDYKEESPLDKDLEKGHKMSDWNETVKATCSSTGTEERVCELGCGHKETRSTEKDPDNHTYGDWVITAATCVADGVKVKTCTNTECKHELKETIAKDPTAHKMATEWEVTKEPTCVETGLQVKACLNAGCDHEVEEVIAIKADAHNLGGWVVTKAAKCTVAGEITRFCKNGNCEYKVTDSLDADGKTHSFAKDFTTIEATCITAGSKFKACENEGCKEVAEKTEIAINPDAHKNVETINVKQPTCEEKGYTGDEFCNDCKKTFEPGIEVDALGHTESDWIVDKEATFTEDGARHTACTVCNKELKKEVIAKRVLETPVVKIENAGSGIKVSWSQDEDATGYTVYRSEYNPSTKKWSKWKNRGTAAATKKNWTDKTVKEGVTYRFTVRSVNGDIKSAYKATSGILYVVAPKVTVSISSTGLLAKWNKINNATSYIVYRAELGTDGNWGKWVQLGTTKAEKNTWSDDKVKSGVTYKYTVRAVVGKVKSGYTGSSAIVYLEQPLLKIANAANGITGKWEQVAGATGYTIYRSEYNPSTKKWTKWLNLGTTKATAKSFTDKTAKSGYQYKYTIRAVNGKLKSTYQDSNKLVCLAQPTLKISNVANGIQGKWTKVDGATGYIIYRSELKDGKWTKWVSLGTAKSTAKSFTDKTVKSGVQYKYTIRAKNGSSKSSYVDSNTSIFLSVPTVKIANAATGVKVTWGKIEGAKNYLVYRSEYNSSTKKWSKWKTLETVDTTSFVDETAVSNVKYKYTVRALNGEFRSYYTASAELLYLKAPTVTAEKEDEAIKVSWTKVDGAKSYIIYRSELSKDGKWSKWIKLGTAGEKYTSCKDKTVKEDVTYKYTVRAVNGKLMGYYVASEQILNGVVTESTPENPKTDIVA